MPADPAPESSRPRGASEIRHPSYARTRRYLKANPLPTQREASAA